MTRSRRRVECHYEVSRSHLHGDPLQIESEEIAIFNRLRAIFNVAEMGRFNVGEIGTGTNIGV